MNDANIEQAVAPDSRPLWRKVLEFPLVAMVIATVVLMGTLSLAASLVGLLMNGIDDQASVMAFNLVGSAGLILAYILVMRHLGDVKRDELPLAGAAKETAIGLGYGFLIFGAIVLIAALLGVYRIEGWGGTGGLLTALVTASIFPAVSEEIFFRGIVFRWVERLAGTWVGLVVSSAAFGAAHLFNPSATWISTLFIALEAGLVLGGIYMLTRNLWTAIGLHAAWNFTQGAIFGVPVSGLPEDGLINSALVGPELLTGGPFGLEASVIALAVGCSVGTWFIVKAVRAGQLVRPMWAEGPPDTPAVLIR